MNGVAIQDGIRQIFKKCGEDDNRLFAAIEDLAQSQGERTYHEALSYLFDKNFSLDRASHYWREATAAIRKPDGSIHSFRAALLDYLRHKTNELHDPRIIESRDLEEIRRSAVTDGLTQLYNQSYFKQQLQQAIDLAHREAGQTFSLVLFDLDHFKQFNDRCGHLQGDQVLRKLGEILHNRCGELDLAARYGGEEFALLLPDCNMEEAIQLAESIREAVARELFRGQDRLDNSNLTISGGIASYPLNGGSASELIEAADRQLYEAKATRNAVLPRLDDTRSASRHQFRNIVELKLPGAGHFTSALSADISASGLSLKSDISATIGTQVSLRFRYPFWPEDLEISGIVRHIGGTPAAGAFKLGIQFEEAQSTFCNMLTPESSERPR